MTSGVTFRLLADLSFSDPLEKMKLLNIFRSYDEEQKSPSVMAAPKVLSMNRSTWKEFHLIEPTCAQLVSFTLAVEAAFDRELKATQTIALLIGQLFGPFKERYPLHSLPRLFMCHS
jgi:hypothetical protein